MKPEFVAVYREQEELLSRVKLANRFISRLRGLMFYQEWPGIDGLLLYPCHSIHMFWMWFPLDILYLDRNGRIVHIIKDIPPNRIGPALRGAYFVLELPAGKGNELHLAIGQCLKWKA